MKISTFSAIAAIALIGAAACKKEEPAVDTVTSSYSGYRILYQMTDKEDSVSIDLAYQVQSEIKSIFATDVKVFAANKVSPTEKEIIIGLTDLKYAQDFYAEEHDTFDYRISWSGKKIFIAAGGSWALKAAVETFNREVIDTKLDFQDGRKIEGSIRGEYLFPRANGTNLRIFDDNIWQYDDGNAAAWDKIGENCTNSVRSQNYIALFQAYKPDIITLQECSNKMKDLLMPAINQLGMIEAGTQSPNYTPIFYNTSTLELKTVQYKKYGDFTPEGGSKISPGASKSYTLAVFEHKATKTQFIMVGTHLWWKTNSAQAGSDLCREEEVRVLMAAIADMLKVYDVPVFLTGDMNCKLSTSAMKQLTNAGYQPLVNIASDYADGSNGWHTCDANGFAREKNHCVKAKGEDCIDQFFLYNDKKNVEVKWFERIHAYFTIKLTDHYPNFTDINLK